MWLLIHAGIKVRPWYSKEQSSGFDFFGSYKERDDFIALE